MRDFQTGVDYVMLCVEVKLGFWADFPWCLCALVQPGLDDSQRQIKTAALIDTFNALPQDDQAHHRVTVHFLSPGSALRSDMEEAFACVSYVFRGTAKNC